MTIGADDVGRRVVVRYRIGGLGPTGGPAMSDVVGRVLAAGGDGVTVERRDGTPVVVAVRDVVSWKHVPERPVRRRRAVDIGVAELVAITSRGWPATESVLLGDWELRTAGRFTSRANSAAAAGDPGVDLGDAVAAVAAFYAARDRAPLAQVVEGSPAEQAFLAAGWTGLGGSHGRAIVQVADLDPAYPAHPDVDLDDRVRPDWLDRYDRADLDREAALAVLQGPPTVAFASIDSPATSIGRVVVTGTWAGISAVETRPDRRRRGQARRVVEASLGWAVAHGAQHAYLQTRPDHEAAIALYAGYGFTTHHAYRYLTATAQSAH
jgi:ribosomal protein S18 acetylase RimI-like enzyme